jgi:hypothetical protein
MPRILLIVTITTALGCNQAPNYRLPGEVVQVLTMADKLELLSLDPKQDNYRPGDPSTFHGWPILGRLEVKDPANRQKIVEAIIRGIEERGHPIKCFEPRHGVHAIRGDETQDLVICFHCCQVEIYPSTARTKFLDSSVSPEPVLSGFIRTAGIPIAPDQTRPKPDTGKPGT